MATNWPVQSLRRAMSVAASQWERAFNKTRRRRSRLNQETIMSIRNYNPSEGQAFQGDVSIIPIPAGISISVLEEISPVKGRLILQEGEVSGHHHAIELRQHR